MCVLPRELVVHVHASAGWGVCEIMGTNYQSPSVVCTQRYAGMYDNIIVLILYNIGLLKSVLICTTCRVRYKQCMVWGRIDWLLLQGFLPAHGQCSSFVLKAQKDGNGPLQTH